MMDYEIVELQEKKVVGISAHTCNEDPNMEQVIGGLWEKLYQGGIYGQVQNKVNDHAIGLYSEYTENGYCVTVGCEVDTVANQELVVKVIPAGRYAKFSIHGHMQKAVAQAWEAIWQMDLDRSFAGDFEEYLNHDFEAADIMIYIALK
ncbi:MAG: GyrI-like domain-containing protein [Cellulosilyticaceae bacterium]